MYNAVAVAASLASLGLVCVFYYCRILSPPDSWQRGDMVAMILLALLTGFFPPAVGASLMGLWTAFAGGFGLTAVLSAGIDLASIGAILATVVVFRALVKATRRTAQEPTNLTPLTPRPVSPQRLRKAA